MKITLDHIEPYLRSLSEKQKDKMLRDLLKKNEDLVERLYFKHLSLPEELDSRYEEYERKVKSALFGSYRAMTDELMLAKAIGEAKKSINEFKKIDKRVIKEVELLMIILTTVFEDRTNPAQFGTCWTKYDFAVTQTLKRVISLLQKKLHEDYLLDYKEILEKYIRRLKASSRFNDFVYVLPDEI